MSDEGEFLITGGSGILGRELRRLFPAARVPSRSELDITNAANVMGYFSERNVDTVIHCAALTSVRTCEEDRKLAWNTNVLGTRNLVMALESGYFVYISTACVFPGDDPGHCCSEDDIPYPKNFYGLTKLLGEREVAGVDNMVVRTNFVSRHEWKYPRAFVDRYGTYLFADQVAMKIKELVRARTAGVVHVCGNRRISMYELAKMVNRNVLPMTLDEYDGPPLTVNMCLTSRRIEMIAF